MDKSKYLLQFIVVFGLYIAAIYLMKKELNWNHIVIGAVLTLFLTLGDYSRKVFFKEKEKS